MSNVMGIPAPGSGSKRIKCAPTLMNALFVTIVGNGERYAFQSSYDVNPNRYLSFSEVSIRRAGEHACKG